MKVKALCILVLLAACGPSNNKVDPLDAGADGGTLDQFQREDVYCRKGALEWQSGAGSASAHAQCDAIEDIPLAGSCSGHHADAALSFDGPEVWEVTQESQDRATWTCIWVPSGAGDVPNIPSAEANICCLKAADL